MSNEPGFFQRLTSGFTSTLGDVASTLAGIAGPTNQIAGFVITTDQIAKNNVTMSKANGGKFSVNHEKIFLSGSGEGQFANGNFKFDKFGNIDITDA